LLHGGEPFLTAKS